MISWAIAILALVLATAAPIIWLLLRSAAPSTVQSRRARKVGGGGAYVADGAYAANTVLPPQHFKAGHHYSSADTDGIFTNPMFDSGPCDGDWRRVSFHPALTVAEQS